MPPLLPDCSKIVRTRKSETMQCRIVISVDMRS
jgi:hypothetical protein